MNDLFLERVKQLNLQNFPESELPELLTQVQMLEEAAARVRQAVGFRDESSNVFSPVGKA